MDTVKLQHNAIKKAQAKEYVTVSLSGLFSYPKDNPSQKRVAECTNIPRTGALPTVKGVGQRLRKGFQQWYRLLTQEGVEGKGRFAVGQSLRHTLGNPAHFESLSSAAEIRHSARNTRLR